MFLNLIKYLIICIVSLIIKIRDLCFSSELDKTRSFWIFFIGIIRNIRKMYYFCIRYGKTQIYT